MTSVREMIEQRLEDDEEDDLLDYISEDEDDFAEDDEDMDRSFPDTVVICNVPKVGHEKQAKLETVLGRIIDKHGANQKHMPLNQATGLTYGFLIVKFESKEIANRAAEQLEGMSLDKTHTFRVVKFDDFDAITKKSDDFTPKDSVAQCSRQDHRDWLKDPQTREQFLLRYNQETEIYWHDTLAGEPQLYYGGEREKSGGKIWCDWKVQFSPQGSFIATFHKQGIALWAGEQFQKWKVRFPHENAKHIEFSPNEEFLLTWNGAHHSEADEGAVKVFRVLTGELCFKTRTPAYSPVSEKGDFPHFLWSRDGRYFAQCSDSMIYVYDTQTFEILKDELGRKRSLKYENLSTFQWSPKDNIIAVWTLEKNNNPARLVLVEVPSRKELAARSRTQVECKMHWQSEGDFLCLLVTKVTKSGKKGATNLEIFRIREKSYPVDIVEVRDTVKAFNWETAGSRFSVITTDDTGHKPKLLFYVLGAEKCEMVQSLDLPSNSFTDVFWAPGGQYFVCAALGSSSSGDLLFGGLMPDNKVEILHKEEHFMLTNVAWDPSSRYVITAVTQAMKDDCGFKYQMEAGYAIWTFQGRKLVGTIQKEKLFAIQWRPHPPSLLDEKKQAYIRKNIKQFSKKYDALDEQAKEQQRSAFNADRDAKRNAFFDILERINEHKEDKWEQNGWADALDELSAQQVWDKHEEVMEEVLDTTEELIQ